MKSQKNNITKKVLIPSVIVCLLLTGTGIYTSLNYNFMNNQNETVNKNESMTLKLLKTSTNSDGSVTKVFGYTIKPDNASDHSVKVSAKYKDNTSCDNVVVVTTSSQDHTISVTVKEDFSKQIILTVTSNLSPNVSAQLTIDYEKKLLSIEDLKDTIQIGGLSMSPAEADHFVTNWNNDDEMSKLFTPSYSKYTIDKSYTYKTIYNSAVYDETFINQNFEEEWLESIGTYLLDVLKNKKQPTAAELWNLNNSNDYHSWLVASSKEGASIGYDVNYTVTCNEQPSTTLTNTATIYLGMNYNYSNFSVLVDELILENSSLIF